MMKDMMDIRIIRRMAKARGPFGGHLSHHYSFGAIRSDTRRIRIIMIAGLVCLGISTSGMADTDEARLATIEKRMATLERQIEKDRSTHGRAVAALRRSEQALADAARKQSELEAQQDATRRELEQINADIRRQQLRLRDNRAMLAAQLRARQAMGDDPWLKVLLSPADPAQTGRMLSYLQYLQHSQVSRIEGARTQLAELTSLHEAARKTQAVAARLVAEQREITENLRHARAERERAVKRLAGTVAGRAEALDRLRQDRARLEAVVTALPAAAQPFASSATGSSASAPEIAALFPKGPIRRLKGRLGWPVPGTVQARFGTQRQEGRMQWQGLLIGAAEGTPVRAVADGEGLFAAWMPYYGLVGIVDHGGGFLSLYGHNQSLVRRPGERVRAGDMLGRVGISGGRQTPALYFEIRQGGNPVNPERWLAATK